MKDFERYLKDEMRKEASRINVKADSGEILREFRMKQAPIQEEKTPWYRRKWFLIGAPLATGAALAGILLGVLIKPESSGPSLLPAGNALLSKVCYELYSGMSYFGRGEDGALVRKAKKQAKGDEAPLPDEFKEMADSFYAYYPMIENVEAFGESPSFYAPIASDDPAYPYCLKLSDSSLCYFGESLLEGDSESVSGLLKKGKESYPFEITTEEETEEGETEIEKTVKLFYSDSDFLLIEKEMEMEQGETELGYSISEIEGDRLKNRIEFELEGEERSFSIELEDFSKKEFEYKFGKPVDGILKMAFEGEDGYEPVFFSPSEKSFTFLGENYDPQRK